MILLIKLWRECIIVVLAFLFVFMLAVANNYAGKLKKADADCKSKIAKIEQVQHAALIKQQDKVNEVSASYEEERADQQVKTQVVYKTIEKIIDRPIYRNVCIDDSGLSELNSLIKADNSS